MRIKQFLSYIMICMTFEMSPTRAECIMLLANEASFAINVLLFRTDGLTLVNYELGPIPISGQAITPVRLVLNDCRRELVLHLQTRSGGKQTYEVQRAFTLDHGQPMLHIHSDDFSSSHLIQ